MPPTDEIPPPTTDEQTWDVLNEWECIPNREARTGGASWNYVRGLIRLLAEARRELAGVREVVRPVLGKEPCPECDSIGCHRTEPNPCSHCVNGTRDVIDGLTLERAVERVVKELQTKAAFFDADHQVTLTGWSQARDLWHKERSGLITERDTARAAVEELQADNERMEIMGREVTHKLEAARAAVETMRERAAKVAELWINKHWFGVSMAVHSDPKSKAAELIAAAIRALPLEPDVKEPTP